MQLVIFTDLDGSLLHHEDYFDIPMMPAWVRIVAAIQDFSDRLFVAVEEDNI